MRRILIPPRLDPLAPAIAGGSLRTLQGRTMGTTWSAKLYAPANQASAALESAIQAELDRVDRQMSTWDPRSDLCRYNRAPAGTWCELPAELFEVVADAHRLAQDSDGAYDPTTGPLVDCWGFGPAPPRQAPPSATEIAEARARVGWQRLELDARNRRARQPGGIALDLSSIAKGDAVDRVAQRLQLEGIEHFLIEVGGELRGQGCKADGGPWWVELESPGDAPSTGENPIDETLVALHGLSAATSGDYRRFFESGGRRYAHTLDPRSGRPVDNALASVCVLHPLCRTADALATLLTVLGDEHGHAYASGRGIAARFLSRTATGLDERVTPAFGDMLE